VALTALKNSTSRLWHRRLGHPENNVLNKIKSSSVCRSHKNSTELCQACQLGNHVRLPFFSSNSKSVVPFEIIHVPNYRALSQEFTMTDHGTLHYFLGIAVKQTSDGLHLSQEKYAYEIIEKADIRDCNSCRTPVNTNAILSSDAGPPVVDPKAYRSLVGAL
ncbi:hypothetical protein V2J09_003471, partial [Rumex salicifolius]